MRALMNKIQLKNYFNQSMSVGKFIDYRRPYKNLSSKISLEVFYQFFKDNVYLVSDPYDEDAANRLAYKLYIDALRDKEIFAKYLNLLKKSDIKSAFEEYCQWIMDRNVFFQTFDENAYKELKNNQRYKSLYGGFLVATITVLDRAIKGHYFIKISKFDKIFPYLTPKVVGVVLDHIDYNTFEFDKTIFKFKKLFKVVNDLDEIKSIYVDINSNEHYFENFTSKNLHRGMNDFKLKHLFMRFEYNQEKTLNESAFYYELNDIYSSETTKYSSVYFRIIMDNIQKYKEHKHIFLLPKIDLSTQYIVSNLLNRIEDTADVYLFFRGIHVIEEYFEDKDKLELITDKPNFFNGMYLIVDTDELHYHIVQLKKSHKISEVILDSDAVIYDGLVQNTYKFMNSVKYKKEYIMIYREFHERMRKIKVYHKVYSVHNEHPEIFRIFKASRFKNYIFYNKAL